MADGIGCVWCRVAVCRDVSGGGWLAVGGVVLVASGGRREIAGRVEFGVEAR